MFLITWRRLAHVPVPALPWPLAVTRNVVIDQDSILSSDLGHRNPRADLQDGPVSLLGHAQLRQHERECQASSGAKVSSIKRNRTVRL